MSKGLGTDAIRGWTLYSSKSKAAVKVICEHCEATGDKRTMYGAPLNPHDPDEGLLVLCFICLLKEREEYDKHHYES